MGVEVVGEDGGRRRGNTAYLQRLTDIHSKSFSRISLEILRCWHRHIVNDDASYGSFEISTSFITP